MISMGKGGRRLDGGVWLRGAVAVILFVVVIALIVHFTSSSSEGPGGAAAAQLQDPKVTAKNYVFIDLGAGNGDTLRSFYGKMGGETSSSHTQFPYDYEPEEWRVYAFEANPKYSADLEALQKEYDFDLYDETAVWTTERGAKFYKDTSSRKGYYVRPAAGEVVGTETDDYVVLKSVSFTRWMRTHVRQGDFAVVKMNLGGAEYDVLKALIDDKSFCLIDQLYVFYHEDRVSGNDDLVHSLPALIRQKSLGIFCQVQILYETGISTDE
ncbi:uncharacterized protein LOC102803962 [Saccoglossus kowalevskii]|uniref:Uncharacterized protein LOC102803962 n=1 Tax=Saccoglossus kowalevskii TaxID=10224 RepID=A0ABM0M5U1_SACKO|nr:PREDICTED: uncharacterized protein LOC102803962 [Saccoglossus kowalevskii]